MELIIRKTETTEYHQTENLTREAFWNLYKPGCDEHLALHQLRRSKSYVDQLDLVAIHHGEIIGHIISTRAKVTDKQNSEYEVLCVGPVSVTPALQNKGIGNKLITYSIAEAKRWDIKQ